jgi:hypothetical protein
MAWFVLRNGALTDARIALFSVWNIFLPWFVALRDPTKRAPKEQTESRTRAFSDEGWNEGA